MAWAAAVIFNDRSGPSGSFVSSETRRYSAHYPYPLDYINSENGLIW
jgi:hypothetical protein